MDDIWTQHEELIRDLYQSKRKTLKQIKQELEDNHGFPIHPLTIYEARLKRLGLHKKLKKEHWPLVYKELCARGDPEFKNSGVYLNGTLIPRLKAWKEIRRSGAKGATIHINGALPPWVAVKTLYHSNAPRPMSHPSVALVAKPTSPIMSPLGLNKFIKGQTESLPWKECMSKLLALQISGPDVVSSLEYGLNSTVPFSIISDDFLNRGPFVRPLGSYCHHYPTPTTDALSTSFDFYQLMTKMIFLVSNNHLIIWPYEMSDRFREQSQTLLDIIINRLPRRLLWNLFRLEILSIRAIWEIFTEFPILQYGEDQDGDSPERSSGNIKGIPGFVLFLIDVALRFHPEWVHEWKARDLLRLLAAMGQLDRIQKLLDMGVCIDTAESGYGRGPIYLATSKSFPDCVSLLIKNCNLSPISLQAEMMDPRHCAVSSSSFIRFIFTIDYQRIFSKEQPNPEPRHSTPNEISNSRNTAHCKNVLNTFQLFLKAGANVDQLYPAITPYNSETKAALSRFYQDSNTPTEWLPTCLDMIFYVGHPLFELAKPYSRRYSQEVTRAGICEAALEGEHGLNQYLCSRSTNWKANTQQYLELILLEQFYRYFPALYSPIPGMSLKIANSLIQFGVRISPQQFGLHEDPSSLLLSLIDCKKQLGCKDEISFIIQHLIQQGAVIGRHTLALAVEGKGKWFLELLGESGANVAEDGGLALATAACENNYEAVSWLLQAGVDVNAEISLREPSSENVEIYTVLGAAAVRHSFSLTEAVKMHFGAGFEFEMFFFLINAKAQMSLMPSDRSPFRLLGAMAGSHFWMTLDNFKSLSVSFQSELGKMTTEEWRDLVIIIVHKLSFGFDVVEDVQKDRLEVAEMILRQHCPSESGNLLSAFIAAGARDELIQEFIRLDADIHLSVRKMDSLQAAASRGNYNLASQLLDMGANINPRVENQESALGLICRWDAVSAEEESRKRSLIQLLLQKGANVNSNDGSALRNCVSWGDLENVTLLLQHGADPTLYDPTSPKFYQMTALDTAMQYGRFDITKLLLNVGAISAFPGSTGYDDALLGKNAITELVHRHITENQKRFDESPSLRIAHAALIEKVEQRRRDRLSSSSDDDDGVRPR